jgi:hypothetical protein
VCFGCAAGTYNSYYVLAWMSTAAATLQDTDLYPVPAADAKLVREF